MARRRSAYVHAKLPVWLPAPRAGAMFSTICPSRAYSIGTSTPGNVTSTTRCGIELVPINNHSLERRADTDGVGWVADISTVISLGRLRISRSGSVGMPGKVAFKDASHVTVEALSRRTAEYARVGRRLKQRCRVANLPVNSSLSGRRFLTKHRGDCQQLFTQLLTCSVRLRQRIRW